MLPRCVAMAPPRVARLVLKVWLLNIMPPLVYYIIYKTKLLALVHLLHHTIFVVSVHQLQDKMLLL